MHLNPRVRKTVGIDLGTTNSVIAVLDPTDTALVTGVDEHGRATFPSLVGYHPEQHRLVAGWAAQALRFGGSTLPLASVKRYMGLDRTFAVGPELLSPAEASACILRHLRDVLATTVNDPRYRLDSAVITMPACFNDDQIEATRQAGTLAGYEVVELLPEPTAAAIYHAWLGNHGDAAYLVYDLGGGTFDVSLIRRRLDDCEVLSVSGDPFLGGDDFDRLLATHLLETGTWTWQDGGANANARPQLAELFDVGTPAGVARFTRLGLVAEALKCELTDAERAARYVPRFLIDQAGRELALEASVERATFQRLIKEKIDRTIDCCHEALGRARERVGLRLADVDYVILVGGSSRVPLVRDSVRAALCNPALAEHVRNPDPLLHEPDLCVAYGAALRAGTHGTRYCFAQVSGGERAGEEIELHLTTPANSREKHYKATGVVRIRSAAPDSWSARIRSLATGLAEEAFLDTRGAFAQEVELQPETDNALEWAVCDAVGAEVARVVTVVRHQAAGRPLGQAVLPTTKPPPPRRPSRAEIDQVVARIDELLAKFRGAFRARGKARAGQLRQDLLEALSFEDEPKVIQRMAELRELLDQLEVGLATVLDPPWPRFAQLVRHCLDLAGQVAERTGRDRDELFEHVYAQERYAEQAFEEHNQPLYHECHDNLDKYAGYLGQLLRDVLPRLTAEPPRPPEDEARETVERFREFLSAAWKRVRGKQRADLEPRLAEIAKQAGGLSQRAKAEPDAAIRDARRLRTEVEKVAALLDGRRPTHFDDTGLLEGSL